MMSTPTRVMYQVIDSDGQVSEWCEMEPSTTMFDLSVKCANQAAALTVLRARVVELEGACAQARAWCIELASALPTERNRLFRRLWPHINIVLRDGKPEEGE